MEKVFEGRLCCHGYIFSPARQSTFYLLQMMSATCSWRTVLLVIFIIAYTNVKPQGGALTRVGFRRFVDFRSTSLGSLSLSSKCALAIRLIAMLHYGHTAVLTPGRDI
jgi:hypothetical protein